MTILIPTEDYADLVDAAERWRQVDDEDFDAVPAEPEPIFEHYFHPYNPWDSQSPCSNGCGASRENPVHFV